MNRLLALLAAMACLQGCAGYWPLRMPQRDLWSAARVQPDPLRMPEQPLQQYSHQLRQDGLTLAVDLLSPAQSHEAFHLDLARRGIQPVLIGLRNDSGQPYEFRKADLGRRVIPASKVGSLECPHPAHIIGGHARWIALFLPGLVFDTIIEPATQLDFPIMHDASRRPSWPSCHEIRQQFAGQELADGPLPPGAARAGIVFLRAVALDSTLTVTLREVSTQEPLALVLPTPSSMASRVHIEPPSAISVWDEVLGSARHVSSWRILSADQPAGVIRIEKRSELEPWAQATPVTVTVRPLAAGRTQVTAESPLVEPVSTEAGHATRTLNQFFAELSRRLEPPASVQYH